MAEICMAFYDEAPDGLAQKYAVVIARYGGRLLWCRHRDRQTWEIPGGHIEPGESAMEAAAREHFTKSVMLDAAPGDPVDSFTAWLVGWTLQLDENATAFLQATAHLTDSTLDDARSANQQTGTGVFEWDSSTYYGDVIDGVPNGAGYIIWDSGERYVGDWVWNDMTGEVVNRVFPSVGVVPAGAPKIR